MNRDMKAGTMRWSSLYYVMLLICLLQQGFVTSKRVSEQLGLTQTVAPRKSVHIGGDVRIRYIVTNPLLKAVRGATIKISLPSCLEILESSSSASNAAAVPTRRLITQDSVTEETRSLSWTDVYVPKKTALVFEIHARVIGMDDEVEEKKTLLPTTLTFPATLSLMDFSSPVSDPVQIAVKGTEEEAEADNHPINHIPVAEAIRDHAPIEEKLHVITVISNPAQFTTRYRLAKDFIRRMEATPNVLLYVAELCYGEQPYVVTEKDHPRHLQLHLASFTPLWHKENMINIAVQQLLPEHWKAFAFIDADVEFTNPEWVMQTLRLLNGPFDIIQPYETGIHLGPDKKVMNIRASTAFQSMRGAPFTTDGASPNFAVPGFAWAMTRLTYEEIGGLYEHDIVGGGDCILVGGLVGNMVCDQQWVNKMSLAWRGHLMGYQEWVLSRQFKLGAAPGTLLHHFHGKLSNRQYRIRHTILSKYAFDPMKHLTKNEQGILIPTSACPAGMLEEITAYFHRRQEDDGEIKGDGGTEGMRITSMSR